MSAEDSARIPHGTPEGFQGGVQAGVRGVKKEEGRRKNVKDVTAPNPGLQPYVGMNAACSRNGVFQ